MVGTLDPRDSKFSTLKEKIVEHLFIGELLRYFWKVSGDNVSELEVLKSEFDAHGYDVVLNFRQNSRHLQIKTGRQTRPGNIKVSTLVAKKDGGCVLWIGVDESLNDRQNHF